MPIRPIEVSTFSKIPSFVPLGVEYFTQDTADLYVGTGASSGPAVTAVNGGSGGGTWGTITGTLSDQTDLQTALNATYPLNLSLNAQTASYVAVLSDNGKLVTMNVASANTFTIPTNASVSFPVGAGISILQLGAGQVTLTPAGGVTINTAGSLLSRAQYSIISVTKIATDTWVAAGDLA